jgi:hypothetical protein
VSVIVLIILDFELGVKENSGMDAAGLGDLCECMRVFLALSVLINHSVLSDLSPRSPVNAMLIRGGVPIRASQGIDEGSG